MNTSNTQTRQIAGFALTASFEQVGMQNVDQLKRHLLDAIGSMIHATSRPAIRKLVNQLEILGGGTGACFVPFMGWLPYDRAAQLYTALIRYPDFMDNFLGKEATCHPSDNIGILLAASQYHQTSGRDFLTAMAIAYQIECRLIQEIPVMKKGIDHTVLLAYSSMAATARLIGLTTEQTAHALGMVGCSVNSLVTSRTSYTYEWKGFASSLDALDCLNIALLAQQGMTGPIAIFEGARGMQDVFDMKLDYNWGEENFELIPRCVLKKYNAEVHAQSAIDATLQLKRENDFVINDIEKIDVTIFLTAYHIIGSGMYGDRSIVHSKEQADHSLFYLIAVALLDDDIYPEQFEPQRINSPDVQELMKKVSVSTGFPLHKPIVVAGLLDEYTRAYPDLIKAKVNILLKNGKLLTCEVEDYAGFFTRPMDWRAVIKKFNRLTNNLIDPGNQQKIVAAVQGLEKEAGMVDFIKLITQIPDTVPIDAV